MAARLQSLTLLVSGSVFFLIAGVFVAIYLPSLDQEAYAPTQYAHQYTAQELRGRAIYMREGCWYCHTQQVRPPEADKAIIHNPGDIGPVSQPGDYVYQKPVFWGTERQGPDLTHVASRIVFYSIGPNGAKTPIYGSDAGWQRTHLQNPTALNPGTLMPSFGYLPDDELNALVAYLLTLK
jgi:cbb3-type cytochrome c oxidase subunit II